MSNRIFAHLSMGVVVHDPDQLRQAAAARALEDGLSPADWEDMRRGPEDDIIMLLDPGSIAGAGLSIEESMVTLI